MRLFSRKNKALAKAADTQQTTEKGKKNSRLSAEVNKAQPDRVQMELGNLRQYADEARDPDNPSWAELYKMYEKTMSDAEVITQRRIAENKLKAEPFVIRANGTDSDDLKKYFEKPWFGKFIEMLINVELYGYRLVEFGQFNDENEFNSCKLFPLLNVYPFNRNIIIDETDTAGIPYSNDDSEQGELINPFDFFLLELGDAESIGLLETITREVIIKSFSRRDWNEHSEKWGQPRIVIKTDAEGTDADRIEDGAKNFARNGYAIVDSEDEVEKFEASNNGSGFLIYDKNIDKSDSYIAKIINGQYGTGQEQAYVGTAEVAERMLDDFMEARLTDAANVINYTLIPFLTRWGYPLENATIHYPRIEEKRNRVIAKKPEQTPEIDEDEQEIDVNQKAKAALKKKIIATSPGDILERWLKRFFDKKVKGIDPEIWKLNFESLAKGIEKAGIKFTDTYKYADLAEELRVNAASFAAFKNHDEQAKLRGLLVDDSGEPRSWNEFKKAAAPITEQYNKTWLQTEFKQAEANSQMAVKWNGFADNADLYPNLEYRTAGDSDVRHEHARMDGVILPISDKFWSRNYPPNGWGCRCDVTQTDKPINEPKKAESIEPDKGFDFNPGADKKLFSDDNGYQRDVDNKEATKVKKEAKTLLNDSLKGN